MAGICHSTSRAPLREVGVKFLLLVFMEKNAVQPES